jgi:hypothetical protein
MKEKLYQKGSKSIFRSLSTRLCWVSWIFYNHIHTCRQISMCVCMFITFVIDAQRTIKLILCEAICW